MQITSIAKLYPSKSEMKLLNYYYSVALEVYNYFAYQNLSQYKNREKINSAYTNKKILTKIKKSENKYKNINRSILNNVIFKLEDSWKSYFGHRKNGDYEARPPRIRKSWNTLVMDNGYDIKDGKLLIGTPGSHGVFKPIMSIPFRGLKEINGDLISEITIKRSDRGYFLHLIYNTNDYPISSNFTDIIGFDWGINSFLTDNHGVKYTTPEFISGREEYHYKEIQKRLSHQKRGSNRYEKNLKRIRKIKDKVTRRKIDYYHKFCHSLTQMFSMICIEDLDLTELRSKKLHHGRSMNNQSPSYFFNILKWHALKNGCEIVSVNPKNTSKTCSDCGFINTDLKLYDREWNCPDCGVVHYRDHNAAINILNLGLFTVRITGSAREVKDRKSITIQDCFQEIGIKREVNQESKDIDLQFGGSRI